MIKIGKPYPTLSRLIVYTVTLWIILTLFSVDLECKDIQVAAVVSPRHIQYNEKATLELTISGNTQIKHIGNPEFNLLPNFLTVPIESKTVPRLVDDKVAVTMAWVYELIPQRLGEISLPDISFLYQGIPYIANPGKILVSAADTYHNASTGGIHKIVAEVSDNEPYINQKIVYQFRYLYTTILPTQDPPTPMLPKFTGFIMEETPEVNHSTTRVDGMTYYVQEHKVRLYPQNNGKVLIPPAQLKLHIKGTPKTLTTKPIPLNIRQLPELGKPASFNGAVGQYNITAQVDRKRLEVRKALTVSLEITGSGNLNSIVSPPKIKPANGLRVDPPTHVKGDTDSKQQYRYVVIPLKAGILQIPAIEFTFFNPKLNAYQTTRSSPIPITVIPNTTDVLNTGSNFPYWSLWVLLIIGCLTIAGYLVIRSKLNSKSEAATIETSETPTDDVYDSLEALSTGTSDSKLSSFGEKLTRILHQYLCERKGEPYRQLKLDDIRGICQDLRVQPTIIQEINDILTKCNQHRFAPVPLSAEDQQVLISRTKTVIQHIEAS